MSMSRRGLLGLMAAAPVAAVAKPDVPVSAMERAIDGPFFIPQRRPTNPLKNVLKIDVDTTDFQRALEDMRELVELQLRNRLPISRAADDERPGAPAKVRAAPPAPQAHHVPSGAPAPDPENPILQHARAC